MTAASWVAVALSVLMACVTAHAQTPQRVVQFNLPAQPLTDALNEWARQANLQIGFFTDIAEGVTSKPLRGRYAPRRALQLLLAGTALEYHFTDARTVEIQPRKPTQKRTDDIPAPVANEPALVTITGTHLRGITATASPVTVYDAESIVRMGVGSIGEFLRKLPQNFALLGPDTLLNSGDNVQAGANSARGAAIDLRGLGSGSTLVLIDGHRITPAGTDGSFADISLIPLSAVERVEIVTDSASAVYGADAVAGVVNFVLRKNIERPETALHYSRATQGGAHEPGVSQSLGATWSGGSGLAIYEYHRQTSVEATDRRFVPQQPGRFTILPAQHRSSVYLAGRQRLGPGIELAADLLHSERSFVQDWAIGDVVSRAEGTTRYTGASAGLRFELDREWLVRLLVHHSGQDNHADTRHTFGTRPAPGIADLAQRSRLSSVDIHADGPLFSAPGGPVRASAGVSVRRERFDDRAPLAGAGTGLERDVASAYGEVFVPLVGELNATDWAQRLEISIAVRSEHYDNSGIGARDFSSLDPKVALLWSLHPGIHFRGTYGKSFRVAPLTQSSEQSSSAQLANLANPASPSGTNTLMIFGGNRALQPENAESFTVGLDLEPAALPGLLVRATCFDAHYTNRVSVPPVQGSPFSIFTQAAILAPFFNLSPEASEVEYLFARYPVLDTTGLGPAGVEAIYDGRFQNIATVDASGLELEARFRFRHAASELQAFAIAERLLRLDHRAVATAPVARLEGRPFNPARLRLRGGIEVERGGFAASLAINVIDSQPGAWTTADLQASYVPTARAGSAWSNGLTVSFAVQNVADRDPPFLPPPLSALGYDATNTSSLGRTIGAQITKRW